MRKNEKGFGAIESLLVVVIVGALGFLGWYVWDQNKSSDTSSTRDTSNTATKESTDTEQTDVYKGWKNYKSTAEGFSIKYPSDWQLTDAADPKLTGVKETIAIKGSNNFTLSFDVYQVTDASKFACENCGFSGATELKNANFGKSLYMVVDSNKVNGGQPFQTLSISDYKVRSEQPIQSWAHYNSKKNSGYVVRWSGEFVKPSGDFVYYTYDEFIKQPEVIEAKKVLESLKY